MNPVVLRAADTARRLVWRAFGPRTIGVRGLVVDEDGQVLLVRHTYGPGLWHLPGGGVKRRESIDDALRRELKEEAGVIVTATPQLLGTFSSLTEGKSDHITVFVVDAWRRVESDSGEIDAWRFFPADALPEDASPATRRRIEEWRTGAVPGFEW